MEPPASMTANRAPQRPRSLCDSKLLSVTPHSLHQHVHQQTRYLGQLVAKRPPPPLPPTRDPSKYRGSWPNMIYYANVQQDANTFVQLDQQHKAPSMAGLMNTTVPQRLVRPGLRGGQHTPTRNSLRHSRMICLSQQQGKVPRKYLPPVIHHYRIGSGLVVAQLFLGLVLLALGLRLLQWAPQLHNRDVPHWSGISLLLSGICGAFLLFCCRKQYPGKMGGGCCVFVVRVQYIMFNVFLAMLATVACLCACVFASVHVSQILAMECQSAETNGTTMAWTTDSPTNSTCLCVGGDKKDELFTYDPLSCSEVKKDLPIYLSTSAVINGLACLVSGCYIILLWSNRIVYNYAGLKLAEFKTSNPKQTLYHQ